MTTFENKQNWTFLILFTYLSLGAFALISQTIMLREFFVVVYGNEFIFAVLLTNWLLGIFAGALTGGRVAERSKNNLMVFVVSIAAMCILLPISITLIRFLYMISGTPMGVYVSFFKVFLFSAALMIPISFFIGFVFPVAAKVQSEITESAKEPLSNEKTVKGISRIYIYEALGSLASGILYTFLLVGSFNSYMISSFMMIPLLLSVCAVLWNSRHYKLFSMALLLFAMGILLSLPPVNGKIEELTVQKRWKSISSLPLTYSTNSKYQNIAVSKFNGEYSLYLNTVFASAFPNENDNIVLASHLLCQHPDPRRILIIGDAVSGLAKFLFRGNPSRVSEIVSVEIDGKIVETMLKFLPEEDKNIVKDKRFKLVIRDGRRYVKDIATSNDTLEPEKRELFDIVYLNVPEPSTLLLNRYYTKEFFTDLLKISNHNGIVALRVTSSEAYMQGIVTDYAASVFNTVRSVFPEMVVTPGAQNYIFASKEPGVVSDNPAVLAKRYETSGMEPKKLGMIFQSLYPKDKTYTVKKVLREKAKSVLNTDETPIATLYFNKIIGWYGDSNISGLFRFFEMIQLQDVIFIIMALFLLRLLYVSVKKQTQDSKRILRFHTLLAVFSSGIAGLSLELVLLYTFQSSFGEIYYIVGFIIALFMFGLPLGAYTANRLIEKNKLDEIMIVKILAALQILTGLISIFLPRMIHLFMKIPGFNLIVIFVGTMIVGFAVGIIFPLSIKLFLGDHPECAGKAAGIINAYDHMGAAIGAFFFGTLLLPVVGVQRVCGLIALFPFISSILLLTDILRVKKSST